MDIMFPGPTKASPGRGFYDRTVFGTIRQRAVLVHLREAATAARAIRPLVVVPSLHAHRVLTTRRCIAEEVLVLYKADKAVEDRELNLKLDAVDRCLVRRLNLVVARELDSDERNVEHQDHYVDDDQVYEELS
jgi:hypothetical protein